MLGSYVGSTGHTSTQSPIAARQHVSKYFSVCDKGAVQFELYSCHKKITHCMQCQTMPATNIPGLTDDVLRLVLERAKFGNEEVCRGFNNVIYN